MWNWLWRALGKTEYTADENDFVTLITDSQGGDLSYQYPWIAEFDITNADDQNKIRRIREALNRGQSFRIFKANSFSDSYNLGTRHLAEINFFPTADDVWDLIGADWGGGTYNVTIHSRSWVLHSYKFDGPSRQPKQPKDEDADSTQDVKGRLIERGLKALESDPDAFSALLTGLIGKEFGVSMPKKAGKESYEEELIREAAEDDPEFKRELVEMARAAKYGGRKEKDSFAEYLKMKKQLNEAGLEKEPDSKSSVMDIIGGVFKEGFSALKDPGVRDGVARIVEVAANPQKPPVREQRPGLPPPTITVAPNPPVNAPPLQIVEQPSNVPYDNGSQPINQPAPAVGDNIQDTGWTDAQWMAIMSSVDLGVLSAAVDNDAEEFIQGLYRLAAEEEHPAAIQLISLIRDTAPAAIHAQIRDETRSKLREDEWKTKITFMFGEETYLTAIEVTDKLATEQGRKWLELANATCLFLDKRIENRAATPVQPAQPAQPVQETQEVREMPGMGHEPVEEVQPNTTVPGSGAFLAGEEDDDGPLV